MMILLNFIYSSIKSLIGNNTWLYRVLIISILVAFSSCKSINYEKIGSIKDYKLSETDIQEISYRLFIASEIDENNMPLNNLRKLKIKSNDKISFVVNWFNINTDKYLITYEWLDMNNRLLDQWTGAFISESNSWITWYNKKMNRIIIPEGKIKLRIKLNNYIMIEEEIEIEYIDNMEINVE